MDEIESLLASMDGCPTPQTERDGGGGDEDEPIYALPAAAKVMVPEDGESIWNPHVAVPGSAHMHAPTRTNSSRTARTHTRVRTQSRHTYTYISARAQHTYTPIVGAR